MAHIFENLLIWSEVWALLIPLCFIFPMSNKPDYLKPVCYYIIIAFFLNLFANLISNQKDIGLHLRWHNNILLYNLHSIVRFGCFTSFFILLKQNHYLNLKKIIPFLYVIILLLNFTVLDKFFTPLHINGNLMTAELYLLLVYCLLYYLSNVKDQQPMLKTGPEFWIVTGLGIYVVINFFLFLFYIPLMTENGALADNMWKVHNVAYIFLCVFIARAFYSVKRYRASV